MLSSGHDVDVGQGGQDVVVGQVTLGHGVDVGHEGHGTVTYTTSGAGQTSAKEGVACTCYSHSHSYSKGNNLGILPIV